MVHAVQTLDAWLRASPLPEGCRLAVLSLSAGSQALPQVWACWAASWGKGADRPQVAVVLGPEGGWSPAEEQALLSAGAAPVSLGPRVLRSETAAVASLAMLASLSVGA